MRLRATGSHMGAGGRRCPRPAVGAVSSIGKMMLSHVQVPLEDIKPLRARSRLGPVKALLTKVRSGWACRADRVPGVRPPQQRRISSFFDAAHQLRQ